MEDDGPSSAVEVQGEPGPNAAVLRTVPGAGPRASRYRGAVRCDPGATVPAHPAPGPRTDATNGGRARKAAYVHWFRNEGFLWRGLDLDLRF
jgi:hypothetical protein